MLESLLEGTLVAPLRGTVSTLQNDCVCLFERACINTSFLIYLEWFLFSHLMLPDILSVPPFRLTFSSIPHSLPFPYSQSLLLTGYYMKLKVL